MISTKLKASLFYLVYYLLQKQLELTVITALITVLTSIIYLRTILRYGGNLTIGVSTNIFQFRNLLLYAS